MRMMPEGLREKHICLVNMEKIKNSLQPLQSLQGLQNVQSVQIAQTAQEALTPLNQWHDNFEVMEMFHISQRTLQTLRSNGKLPFAKMGGRCYYKESDLQRLLEDSYRDSRIKPMPASSTKDASKEVTKNVIKKTGEVKKGGTTCP